MATKAKKSESAQTSAEPEVKKVTMAKFLDTLLLTGGKIEDITAKCAAEAKKRGVPTLSTVQLVRAHIKYRIKRNELPINFEDGVVTLIQA